MPWSDQTAKQSGGSAGQSGGQCPGYGQQQGVPTDYCL